jgi:predicted nucleotide-binding protein
VTSHQELFKLADELAAKAALGQVPEIAQPIAALRDAVHQIARSFSGSWLGYHSRVYYANFLPPPPGARFSQEWGLMDTMSGMGSRGEWQEHDVEDTKAHILRLANNPDLSQAHEAAAAADELFQFAKSDMTSIIQTEIESGADRFLETLAEQLNELKTLSTFEVAQRMNAGGQVMTRDTIVLGQGTQLPPHVAFKAEYRSIEHSFAICHEASAIARKAASHIERKAKRAASTARIGTNVFIGHGRAGAWRDLKDFAQDRLGLPWDEFNRVPVAGVTNVARLSEMLDAAAIAFIVMTAEDERTDGTVQARMNVIHEAGLFQGRLGFTKAIVMIEDGCEEFTNISGLGQIRFPAGNISAVFEEVRRVLEREGVLEAG